MYTKFTESMERYAINISKNMYNWQAASKKKIHECTARLTEQYGKGCHSCFTSKFS